MTRIAAARANGSPLSRYAGRDPVLPLSRYAGRGQGEGLARATGMNPHPDALPAYRARGKYRGFTLVEVLATLMLLGIVMPVAMKGVSIALAAAEKARHTAEAATLAETKLNDLLTQGVNSASGLTGDFSPDHPEYQWSYQSAPRDYGITEVQLRLYGIPEAISAASPGWSAASHARSTSPP